jgi:hypothetical protein
MTDKRKTMLETAHDTWKTTTQLHRAVAKDIRTKIDRGHENPQLLAQLVEAHTNQTTVLNKLLYTITQIEDNWSNV